MWFVSSCNTNTNISIMQAPFKMSKLANVFQPRLLSKRAKTVFKKICSRTEGSETSFLTAYMCYVAFIKLKIKLLIYSRR